MIGFLFCWDVIRIPKFKFTTEELEKMESNPWLTWREREVFRMYYKEGRSIEYIGAELDVNRSTIDRDLRKIRSKTIKSI